MKSDLEAFKKFEHKAWNTIADRYEDAWGKLTRLFIPHLLDAVKVEEGNLLLDVASGPGFVARAASKLGAVPVGVDFSAEMVRIARDRNPGIEFHEGDAQALEFEDNHFDIVVMNFAALHLSDPAAAFAEARRVLRLVLLHELAHVERRDARGRPAPLSRGDHSGHHSHDPRAAKEALRTQGVSRRHGSDRPPARSSPACRPIS